jgi:hypothetical protein
MRRTILIPNGFLTLTDWHRLLSVALAMTDPATGMLLPLAVRSDAAELAEAGALQLVGGDLELFAGDDERRGERAIGHPHDDRADHERRWYQQHRESTPPGAAWHQI